MTVCPPFALTTALAPNFLLLQRAAGTGFRHCPITGTLVCPHRAEDFVLRPGWNCFPRNKNRTCQIAGRRRRYRSRGRNQANSRRASHEYPKQGKADCTHDEARFHCDATFTMNWSTAEKECWLGSTGCHSMRATPVCPLEVSERRSEEPPREASPSHGGIAPAGDPRWVQVLGARRPRSIDRRWRSMTRGASASIRHLGARRGRLWRHPERSLTRGSTRRGGAAFVVRCRRLCGG